MKKTIIAIIIVALIIVAGITIYLVLQKPQVDKCDLNKDGKVSAIEQQKCEQGNGGINGKCGDGICGTVEKEKGTCPEDCTQPTQQPEERIGFVGCSLTLGSVDGYSTLGGTKFWPYKEANAYSGGSVSAWYSGINSASDKRWQTFQSLMEKYPKTKIIWWELCTGTESNTYIQITSILNKIKTIAPDAEIYVSAIPERKGYTCSLEKNEYTIKLEDYAEQLVQEGKAKKGPVMTPLTISQVGTDKCHPNPEGQEVWGKNLIDFFGKGEPLTSQNQAPTIYVSVVTHNEEPLSGQYPDFVNDEDAFWEHREAVVNFAEMLKEEGVKYNYQSDWNFLLAATMYDQGTSSTNGKNFLRYLKEDLGAEIDPHAHETQYNYADVAYLIKELGVTPSHIVGGFLASPPEQSKVEYFRQSLKGIKYPDYDWKAEILWGGGTYKHQDDEELLVSGVWKPKDNENFLIHDGNAPLPNVGGYKSNWQGLNDLLQKQQNGELEEGKIYTQTIFAGQLDMLRQNFIEDFRQQIRNSAEYEDAGLIKWVGLKEAVDIWKSEYNSEPNIYAYKSASTQQSGTKGKCGDGVCGPVEKQKGTCPEDCK